MMLREAQVRAVREIASDVRLIELEPADGVRPFAAGSHLEVQVHVAGAPQLRSYSLIGAREGEPGGEVYRIAVRRLAQGRGGSLYMWSLAAGARIPVSPPRSSFELTMGQPEYLLVAAGIGITPLIGMAERLDRAGARVRLLYAGRARGAMPFLAELHARLGDRLRTFVSAEGERLDPAAAIAELHPLGELYVCGPLALLEAVQAAWHQAGRPPGRLRFETFGSSGRHPRAPFVARVRDHAITVSVPRDGTLLDALAAAGVELPADCLRGECGLCTVRVVACDGALDHRDVFLSTAEKTRGDRLCACVGRVHGGSVTIDTGYTSELA